MTPTQRSLTALRGRSFYCQVVEHWNAHARVRQDLYGFIDIACIRADQAGILGVQTTTAANLQARITKAMALKPFLIWLQGGNRVEFHGWKKVGGRWECVVKEAVLQAGKPLILDF